MTALSIPKDQIAAFREEFLTELPTLAREYIDSARSEMTTAAYEKVMNTALKVIEGLEVQQKKDIYANLPVIHVSFGPGMEMATTVEEAKPAAPQIEDAVVKSPFQTSASKDFGTLPDDPLELLPTPESAEEAEVLRQLDAAGSAMVMEE